MHLPGEERRQRMRGPVMEDVRRIDDYARMMASGIKQDLKEAKDSFKNEYHPSYIDIFHFLNKISDALRHVAERAEKLQAKKEKELSPSATRTQLSEPELRYLHEQYKRRKEEELARAAWDEIDSQLMKMSRDNAARTLEKLHGNIASERYESARRLVFEDADMLVGRALEAFKQMDKARAKGDVGKFLQSLELIGDAQEEFQVELDAFNESHVQPLIRARLGIEEEEKPEKTEEPEEPEEDSDKKKKEPAAEEAKPKPGKEESFEEEAEGGEQVMRTGPPEEEGEPGEAYMEQRPEQPVILERVPRERWPTGTPGGRGGKWRPPVEVFPPLPASGILPQWQQIPMEGEGWQGAKMEDFEWNPKLTEPSAEAYSEILGMVKEAMSNGNRKTAGKLMVDYSKMLMRGGLKDKAYEARVMALELLSDG